MREVQSVFPGRMVHVYYVTIGGERFGHFFLLRDEVLLYYMYIVYLFRCPSPPHCVTSLCLTAGTTLYNVYVLRIRIYDVVFLPFQCSFFLSLSFCLFQFVPETPEFTTPANPIHTFLRAVFSLSPMHV